MLETSARLLRLLSLFQARRDWNSTELAARLDVTTRTIRNDIVRLRAPRARGRGGGRVGRPLGAAPAGTQDGPGSGPGRPAGPAGRRSVEPSRLVNARRRWSLVAWDAARDAGRPFRVARIEPQPPA